MLPNNRDSSSIVVNKWDIIHSLLSWRVMLSLANFLLAWALRWPYSHESSIGLLMELSTKVNISWTIFSLTTSCLVRNNLESAGTVSLAQRLSKEKCLQQIIENDIDIFPGRGVAFLNLIFSVLSTTHKTPLTPTLLSRKTFYFVIWGIWCFNNLIGSIRSAT